MRPLQRTALQLVALWAQLGQLEIAAAQNGGQRPPGFDALMLGVREVTGQLGMVVAVEQARRRFDTR